LRFAHCGQLAGGLAPPGVRPCRAHKKGRVLPPAPESLNKRVHTDPPRVQSEFRQKYSGCSEGLNSPFCVGRTPRISVVHQSVEGSDSGGNRIGSATDRKSAAGAMRNGTGEGEREVAPPPTSAPGIRPFQP